jgi:hypothetical protein
MAQMSNLIASAAVIALTLGMGDALTPAPNEMPYSNSDIVIVANDPPPSAQTEDSATESAKMGEEEGTHTGAQGEKAENDTSKIDQPERRNETTSNLSGKDASPESSHQ